MLISAMLISSSFDCSNVTISYLACQLIKQNKTKSDLWQNLMIRNEYRPASQPSIVNWKRNIHEQRDSGSFHVLYLKHS